MTERKFGIICLLIKQKSKNMKLWVKIALIVGAVVIVIGGIVSFVIIRKMSQPSLVAVNVDLNNPPKFIQANFVDLSKIFSISKFRSGEGHDFSAGDETCRSMKHYFTQQFDPNLKITKDAYGKTIPPQPDGVSDVDIVSPVDGTITQIASETFPVGKQIYIVPDSNPEFTIRLFHVYPVSTLQAGSHVHAAEKIGVIAKGQGTDVAVQLGDHATNFISYFSVLPDSLFAAFHARGVTSRDELIITKEYRDAHPLQCGDAQSKESFVYPADYDATQDDVHLSGYIKPTQRGQNMQQNSGNQNGNNGTNQNSNGNQNQQGGQNNSGYQSGQNSGSNDGSGNGGY